MKDTPDTDHLLSLTRDIVSAYVSHNTVSPSALSGVIENVFQALQQAALGQLEGQGPRPEPVVPIDQSVTEDAIICLEDGLPFKSLKRHIKAKFGLTPEAYREKWGLPRDYPMVAPNYAKERSALAKKSGLGRKSQSRR